MRGLGLTDFLGILAYGVVIVVQNDQALLHKLQLYRIVVFFVELFCDNHFMPQGFRKLYG